MRCTGRNFHLVSSKCGVLNFETFVTLTAGKPGAPHLLLLNNRVLHFNFKPIVLLTVEKVFCCCFTKTLFHINAHIEMKQFTVISCDEKCCSISADFGNPIGVSRQERFRSGSNHLHSNQSLSCLVSEI